MIEKRFYNLKEISEIVDLKYRQLQNRLKKVIVENIDRKHLIYKKCNRWFIDSTLIKYFERKFRPLDYQLFITSKLKITPQSQYNTHKICIRREGCVGVGGQK